MLGWLKYFCVYDEFKCTWNLSDLCDKSESSKVGESSRNSHVRNWRYKAKFIFRLLQASMVESIVRTYNSIVYSGLDLISVINDLAVQSSVVL